MENICAKGEIIFIFILNKYTFNFTLILWHLPLCSYYTESNLSELFNQISQVLKSNVPLSLGTMRQ